MVFYAPLITALLTVLSFYFRLNFWPLSQKFGFYQGDIWYFLTFYGEQIKNQPFYQMDYPVGYVLIQKLTAFFSVNLLQQFSYPSFLLANAILMIPLSTLSTLLLIKITQLLNLNFKTIFFYFVLSPSLFVYSTINYDLFPLFTIVLSIYLLLKNRFLLSILSLAIGFLIKIFPGFLIPLFTLFIYQKTHSSSKTLLTLGLAILTIIAINLPFAFYNFQDWSYPYLYQSKNPEASDPTTLSYYLNYLGLANYRMLLLVVLITFSYLICYYFYKVRRLTPQNIPLLSYLILFSLVLGNHVYTPQYLLWFLPFTALTKIPQLLIWYPFDILNASTRFFYFQLTTNFTNLFFIIHTFTIIYFVFLYLSLLARVKKSLSKTS